MFTRLLLPKLKQALQTIPVVAILGPRQIGKTTLALKAAEDESSIYLDLEASADVAKLDDPAAYLSLQKDKLTILDEIQEVPELFKPLRGVIDKGRQQGKGNGQFLILGSASPELLQQSSETLAGRIIYLELASLTPLEVEAKTSDELNKLWVRGGFPMSYLANSDEDSAQWRENFIRTYLERDIPQLGPRVPTQTLRRLWIMLAHSQGTMLNTSKLATNLDLSSPTVKRYIDLLEELFMVRRLAPWSNNGKKRLVKSPKIYLRDSGLLHQLLNIESLDDLLAHPISGTSWEGFIIENLLNVAPRSTTPYFYRTSVGAEIDLLLELPKQERWAIEIKKTSAPKVERGFYEACDDLEPTRKLIVYNGTERFPLKNNVEAIGLNELMKELMSL